MARETGKTYEQLSGPPAWTWDRYDSWLREAWDEHLKAAADDETQIQAFLERHPCLVPGGEGTESSIGGHHGAFPDWLISQPELPGLTRPRPDFLWISKTSEEVNPVLIEIERPSKRWFRPSDGIQDFNLTQAVDQLAAWKTWFGKEAHRPLFFDLYGVDDHIRELHTVNPVYCLIYGRRAEFETDGALRRKRSEMRPEWLQWMTYDRLQPQFNTRHAFSVKRLKHRWVAVAVPPTFQLGPNVADSLLNVEGLDEAIGQSDLLEPARKSFLIERLPYWQEWARQDSRGVVFTGDWE